MHKITTEIRQFHTTANSYQKVNLSDPVQKKTGVNANCQNLLEPIRGRALPHPRQSLLSIRLAYNNIIGIFVWTRKPHPRVNRYIFQNRSDRQIIII